ncbi:MAG: hypothetical protein N3G48_05380 [Sulfolobales archaeon]|nr:hypothetical protein [Sulfolobales archaeon]
MSHKVYLGESLSTLASVLTNPNSSQVIIDIWDEGSLLSGIQICNTIVDKAPLLMNGHIPIADLITIHPNSIFIGSESSYIRKVSKGVDLQRNWLLELSRGGKMPRNFFHSIYKKFRHEAIAKRVYDVIDKLELSNRRITLLRYGTVSYDKLVNSLPLPYIMSKVDLNPKFKNTFLKLGYVSLLIGISVAKVRVEEYTTVFIGKTNIVPHTVVLIPLKILKEDLIDYVLIYSVTSIKRPYSDYKGEYVSRLLNDVKKLGFKDVRFICSKLVFEKFGLLGNMDADLEAVINILKDHDVELLGRLGTWREISITDILDHAGVL